MGMPSSISSEESLSLLFLSNDKESRKSNKKDNHYYCPIETCNNNNNNNNTVRMPFSDTQSLLSHLYTMHYIKILNPSAILPILNEYLDRALKWKHPSTLPFDTSLPLNPSITILGENDQSLRNELLNNRLVEILNIQSWEREHVYHLSATCLFCPIQLDSKRSLFHHMYHSHSFNLGLLDNLVWIDEYLQCLHDKLSNNQCIYCERIYSDSNDLQRHLKSKRHFKIHPKNHQYDKYYIVNYRIEGNIKEEKEKEKGGGELIIKNKKEKEINEKEDSSWSDLDCPIDYHAQCLFCIKTFSEPGNQLFVHLKCIHGFDYDELLSLYPDDYDRIKITSYIQSQTRLLKCIREGRGCMMEKGFLNIQDLFDHYTINSNDNNGDGGKCCRIDGLRDKWDKSEYLFPVHKDDPLLWHHINATIDD